MDKYYPQLVTISTEPRFYRFQISTETTGTTQEKEKLVFPDDVIDVYADNIGKYIVKN